MAGSSPAARPLYWAKLEQIAETIGLKIAYRKHRAKRRNGWPMESERPFHIIWPDGQLIAAFRTLELMERNLRARAGC